MSEKAILFDTSRCSACRGCQVACKVWNGLPSPLEKNGQRLAGSYQHPLDLNGDTRLVITFDERVGGAKGVEWAFGRRSCQHCANAACASVCPSGALAADGDTGLVTVDEAKCIGCRYCSLACPYDVPRYYGERGLVNKCTGCADRVQRGMEPACVATCQPNALTFGDRDALLAEAHDRAERLRRRGWERASVYGEHEQGGLHVVQVLKYGAEGGQHGAFTATAPDKANGWVEASQAMRPVTAAAAAATATGLAAMTALAAGYRRDPLAYNPATGDTINTADGSVVKQGDGPDILTVREHLTENLGRKRPTKEGE